LYSPLSEQGKFPKGQANAQFQRQERAGAAGTASRPSLTDQIQHCQQSSSAEIADHGQGDIEARAAAAQLERAPAIPDV
jgi:hypothetical protein